MPWEPWRGLKLLWNLSYVVWRLDINHETETQGQFHGYVSVAKTLVIPARTSLCLLGLFLGRYSVRFMPHYNVSAWFLFICLVSRKNFPLRGRSPLPCHLPVVSSLLWLITATICCQERVCNLGGGAAHAISREEEAELRIKWKQVLAEQWQPCSPACIPYVQQGPHSSSLPLWPQIHILHPLLQPTPTGHKLCLISSLKVTV